MIATKRYLRSGSTFLQNTLSSGYPRLLRLFHEFFAKIAVYTDTVYTPTYQRWGRVSDGVMRHTKSFIGLFFSPETVLVLRSVSIIESAYLSKSTNKLNEAVGQAFSGGARSPPGSTEGISIARAVANELDAARFDPLLVRAVAKIAASSLDMMVSRAENLVG